jgi:hypothetical protein
MGYVLKCWVATGDLQAIFPRQPRSPAAPAIGSANPHSATVSSALLWQTKNYARYKPLNVNSISTKNPAKNLNKSNIY